SNWLGRPAGAVAVVALPAPTLDDLLAEAAEARAQAARSEPEPALPAMAGRLGLSVFETDTLLLCAAMELDPSIGALIAVAQGSTQPTSSPSFGLAMRLFDDPAWDALAPQRPLRYLRLLEINQPGATALTAAALRADERIVNSIKGLEHLDERVATLVGPPHSPAPISDSQQACCDSLLALLHGGGDDGVPPVMQLLGPHRGSRLAVAAHACHALGRHLHRLPLESL